jgi:chromosome segregation ATPase
LERTSERIDTQASDSASVYYLVVCSDTPVSFTVASAHANPEHDALQSEMHEYKQAMTTLSEQNAYVGTLQSYIEDRENHLQQAHQKMGELHEKASTLEHRTLHLDSIVSGKQEEIASLQEEITSLNGQLSTLTGERDSLRDRLNRIEASLPYRVYRKLRGLTGTSGSQA